MLHRALVSLYSCELQSISLVNCDRNIDHFLGCRYTAAASTAIDLDQTLDFSTSLGRSSRQFGDVSWVVNTDNRPGT